MCGCYIYIYTYIHMHTHIYIYIYIYLCVCAIWISLHSFQVEVNWPLGARSAPETRSRSDTWRSFGLDWDFKMHQLTSHDFYSQYLWDNCAIIVGSWDLCGIMESWIMGCRFAAQSILHEFTGSLCLCFGQHGTCMIQEGTARTETLIPVVEQLCSVWMPMNSAYS